MKAAKLLPQSKQDVDIDSSWANSLGVASAAPNGVKKLRELVLELAIRGKIVPQDPKDIAAGGLLRSTETDKERKEKLLPTLEEVEKPFNLPKGWKWEFFPTVADYKVGKTPPTKSSVFWSEKEIPWVSISDMPHYGDVSQTERHVSAAAAKEIFRYPPIPAGTLLMSFKLTVGKVSMLAVAAYHNEAIISVLPCPAVDKNYLFRFLPLIAKTGKSKNAIKGNTLNSESIAGLLIPVPPLAEQKRIVAKVDELMTLCDRLEAQEADAASAHETLVKALLGTLTQSQTAKEFQENWQRIAKNFDTLFTTESSIDTLKQTILQLAVMGRLVPQSPKDEPAHELLKRISTEKEELNNTKKIKDGKHTVVIQGPYSLPKGWEWVQLGQIVSGINSGWSPACLASAKHEFQLLKKLTVDGRSLIFNVDLMHPAEVVKKGEELFQNVLDLGIRQDYDPANRWNLKSICFPSSQIIFDKNLWSLHPVEKSFKTGEVLRFNIPIMDESALILSKCESVQVRKRKRDAFDIYFVLTGKGGEITANKLRDMAGRFQQVDDQLMKLKKFLDSDAAVFDANVQKFCGDKPLKDNPAQVVGRLLF